jgi:predicted ATPase
MALFVECAKSARPGFRLDDRTLGAISRIVHGVEGIPLAIELSASRLRVLAPGEIAAGLSDRLRLLGGGPARSARHHTMRATLDWSYDLLDPKLAGLFARLSICAGGWTLAAAEAVCADDQVPAADMLDSICPNAGGAVPVGNPLTGQGRARISAAIRSADRRPSMSPIRRSTTSSACAVVGSC